MIRTRVKVCELCPWPRAFLAHHEFALRTQPGSVAILLDPDVARVFKSAESVNTLLRALMATMPNRRASRG
ncbi:hypothetical protein SBA4_890002 [Candidatus Sulfopaludibacter sp. SbA4]|nr:hypothetical protein SBA4_890002 [Candidatus Sulfopaludibacter sp. SbA4]